MSNQNNSQAGAPSIPAQDQLPSIIVSQAGLRAAQKLGGYVTSRSDVDEIYLAMRSAEQRVVTSIPTQAGVPAWNLEDIANACVKAGLGILEANSLFVTLRASAPAEAPSVRDAALEEAAQLCESEICACCWEDGAEDAALYLATAIRALQGKPEGAGDRNG